MSYEQKAKQLMNALPSGKKNREHPRTRWRNYVEKLAWSRLGIPQAKLPLARSALFDNSLCGYQPTSALFTVTQIFNFFKIFKFYSKNGQVNQQASADRPVSSLLGLVRTLQLVVDPS